MQQGVHDGLWSADAVTMLRGVVWHLHWQLVGWVWEGRQEGLAAGLLRLTQPAQADMVWEQCKRGQACESVQRGVSGLRLCAHACCCPAALIVSAMRPSVQLGLLLALPALLSAR